MKRIELKELRRIFRKLKPERVLLVSSADENGKANVMTVEWFMRTSFDPPMVAVSIGKTRYTHELIKKTKEFVVAFPKSEMGREAIYCGTYSGREVDKIKNAGLKTRKSVFVKPPLIENCVLNLECSVVNEIETGDHTIFIGKVLAAHYEEGEILIEFENKFCGVSDLKK